MYKPRTILPLTSVPDPDGLKLYTISASGSRVDFSRYSERLLSVKRGKGISTSSPGFAILHDGAACEYLVVGWWGNSNELFLSVSVKESSGWVEDMAKHSFCLWDLEVIWHERNSFIRHLYSGTEDLESYRRDMKAPMSGDQCPSLPFMSDL
jgi:hypothetical protein